MTHGLLQRSQRYEIMLPRCHLRDNKKGQGKSNTSVWTQSQKKKVQQSIWVFMSIFLTRYSTASNDPYDENIWNEDGFEIYSRAAIVNLSWEHRCTLCCCLENFIRRSHFKSELLFFFTAPSINSNINMHYSRQAFMQCCLWEVPGVFEIHTHYPTLFELNKVSKMWDKDTHVFNLWTHTHTRTRALTEDICESGGAHMHKSIPAL